MTARAPLTAEAGIPAWAVRLVRQINDWLRNPGPPPRPVVVFSVPDAASLPLAGQCRFCAVYVADIDRLAVSNGTDWIRQDDGSAL